MGTFARMVGTATIPENKREELREREYKLFCEGGMCAFEELKLYGKTLYLLTAPEVKQNGSFDAWYNYFEDRSWEDAGYNADDVYVWSNKVGWSDFNMIVFAAYILEEKYSTTPCYAYVDDRRRILERYVGWLNYLFDENFTMQNRNFWNVLLAKRDDVLSSRWPDEKIKPADLLDHVASEKFDFESTMAGISALRDDIYKDKILLRDPEHEFSQDIYDLYQCMEKVKLFCEETDCFNTAKRECDNLQDESKTANADADRQINAILDVMCGADAESFKNCTEIEVDILEILVSFMKKVKPQDVVRLISNLYQKDFWGIWKLIDGRNTICQPYIMEAHSVEPISTQDFLAHETRNYLYYWRKENGISLDGLDGWFAELKDRYDRLMADEKELDEKINSLQMMQEMMTVLDKANAHYGAIFAFSDMFYEFVENSDKRCYQAWWKIFCDLVEENWNVDKINEEKISQGKSYFQFEVNHLIDREKPARAEIKGYLGLMANKELRAKVFTE